MPNHDLAIVVNVHVQISLPVIEFELWLVEVGGKGYVLNLREKGVALGLAKSLFASMCTITRGGGITTSSLPRDRGANLCNAGTLSASLRCAFSS